MVDSAEMIHALSFRLLTRLLFSCNIRNAILDNGAFSKPIFSKWSK